MNWQEKDLKSLSYRGVREKKKYQKFAFHMHLRFPSILGA